MPETILVVNAGSSSINFQLFGILSDGQTVRRRLKGQIEGIGARPRLFARGTNREILIDETWPATEVSTVPAALDKLIVFLRREIGGRLPVAVGHRVVHGAP
jgi:acetate kinase